MTTKPKPKVLTPKQAEIKGTSLIRGIDNSVARIRKETASIADATSQLKKVVLPALSNPTKAPTKAPVKPAQKAAQKAKPAPAKKPTAAQSPSKAAQKAKPPVDGRPTIKEAIQEMVKEHGPISPADLWKKAVDKYGYWSRQSLYNALKDTKLFSKKDGAISLTNSVKKADDDVDTFVDNVVSDKSVAHAT